jgi:hypothetical protein
LRSIATLLGSGSGNDFRPRAWPRTMLRSIVSSLLERPSISERETTVPPPRPVLEKSRMDRVFTAIARAALPKPMVYADFAAAPALISDYEVSDRRLIGSSAG